MTTIKEIIRLLRPHQYAKNTFVLVPLFFDGHLMDSNCFVPALMALLAYSFAASSIYCFNDIWDVNADRKHPKKCNRPIASGAISKIGGYLIMGVMLSLSIAVCVMSFNGNKLNKVLAILLFYWIMNIAYCVRLKQVAILDVFIIATGFMLRILIGGWSTDIWVSQWTMLLGFMLALFLAFAKRRDDVVLYKTHNIKVRSNVNRYNLQFINQALSIIASLTMMCYIMYTVSQEVMIRLQSPYLYFTAIFVLGGMIRYLQLTIVDANSGSPTRLLMHDRFIQFCILGWTAAFIFIIYKRLI